MLQKTSHIQVHTSELLNGEQHDIIFISNKESLDVDLARQTQYVHAVLPWS